MRKVFCMMVMLVAILLLTGSSEPIKIWGPGAPQTTEDRSRGRDDVLIVEVDRDNETEALRDLRSQRGVQRVERVEGPYYRVYVESSVDISVLRALLLASALYANVGFEYHASVEVRGGCSGPSRRASSGGSSGGVWGPGSQDKDDDKSDDSGGGIWGPDTGR